jgi:hypothetical protein
MKKALLVGINKWKNLPDATLQGCVNDANDIKDVIVKQFGYLVKNIKVLLDSKASKKAIKTELVKLIKNSVAGDDLLFCFSCHGTQIDDKNKDEPDGQDEAICPADLSYDNWEGTLLVDDEIYEIFKLLPKGVNLCVIADCCHADTNTKELNSKGIKSKFIKFPNKNKGKIKKICKANKKETQRHVLLAACRSNETSADAFINNRYNGAATRSILIAVENKPEGTWKEIFEDASKWLDKEGYEQHLVLSGDSNLINNKIFGGKTKGN